MSKFKVGDRVVELCDSYDGLIGVVQYVNNDRIGVVFEKYCENGFPEFSPGLLEHEEIYNSPLYKVLNED
jgi:hypothetical protein